MAKAVQECLSHLSIDLSEAEPPLVNLSHLNEMVRGHSASIQGIGRNFASAIVQTVSPGLKYNTGKNYQETSSNHYVVNYSQSLSFKFNVSKPFLGSPFVLSLSHLTTSFGDARGESCVNFSINGNIIRERFDPRTAHEVNNNKAGYWSFADDLWCIPDNFIKEGDNNFEIIYVGGSSNYWIQKFSISTTLPATKTITFDSEKLKNMFQLEFEKCMIDYVKNCLQLLRQALSEPFVLSQANLYLDHVLNEINEIDSLVKANKEEIERKLASAQRALDILSASTDKLTTALGNFNSQMIKAQSL